MTDVLTPEQRRHNMSRIKGRNTGPELKLRQTLSKMGVRGYRLNCDLPGKPDIVFTRRKLAIFVDGCFWHKCPLHFALPTTRSEFWLNKLEGNVKRDREVDASLKKAGWYVQRFWEHEIRENPGEVAAQIAGYLNKQEDVGRFS